MDPSAVIFVVAVIVAAIGLSWAARAWGDAERRAREKEAALHRAEEAYIMSEVERRMEMEGLKR